MEIESLHFPTKSDLCSTFFKLLSLTHTPPPPLPSVSNQHSLPRPRYISPRGLSSHTERNRVRVCKVDTDRNWILQEKWSHQTGKAVSPRRPCHQDVGQKVSGWLHESAQLYWHNSVRLCCEAVKPCVLVSPLSTLTLQKCWHVIFGVEPITAQMASSGCYNHCVVIQGQ